MSYFISGHSSVLHILMLALDVYFIVSVHPADIGYLLMLGASIRLIGVLFSESQ